MESKEERLLRAIFGNEPSDWEEDLKFEKNGDSFKFRQVFHIEHIVPISIIIEELLKLDLSQEKDIIYKKMNAILNKIYVCL